MREMVLQCAGNGSGSNVSTTSPGTFDDNAAIVFTWGRLRSPAVTDVGEGLIAPASRTPVLTALGIGALLVVEFVAPIRNELHFAIFPQDEGILLVYPTEILKGAIPNHTFDSVYGILNLWVIAGAFKVFGATLTVERYVGVFYRLVLVASLVVLAWRRRGPVAGFAAGAMCIVLLTGTLGLVAFAWMGALACCAVALLLIDVGLAGSARSGTLVAAGFAFGLGIGCRLDIGLAVVLVLGAVMWFRHDSVRGLLIGLLVGLVPLLVNMIQAGPTAVVRDQFIDPVFVSGPARRLPLSTLTGQELALLGLCVAVAVATIIVGAVRLRADRTAWSSLLLLAVGLFEIAILPQAFQRSDSLHLSYVACFVLPAAVLLPPWRLSGLPGWLADTWQPVAAGIVVLAVAWPSFGSVYWMAATSSGAPVATVTNDGRSVILGSAAEVAALAPILGDLDRLVRPGARVFVGPSDLRTSNYNDTYLYYLLPELTPGSYYLEMNPGVANGPGSQLTDDLSHDQFLILTSEWNVLPDQGSVPPLGPDKPNQVVADDFTPVRSSGTWTLYRRTSNSGR
jgi:hypothetical protein